jgi:hypothetical protein
MIENAYSALRLEAMCCSFWREGWDHKDRAEPRGSIIHGSEGPHRSMKIIVWMMER